MPKVWQFRSAECRGLVFVQAFQVPVFQQETQVSTFCLACQGAGNLHFEHEQSRPWTSWSRTCIHSTAILALLSCTMKYTSHTEGKSGPHAWRWQLLVACKSSLANDCPCLCHILASQFTSCRQDQTRDDYGVGSVSGEEDVMGLTVDTAYCGKACRGQLV